MQNLRARLKNFRIFDFELRQKLAVQWFRQRSAMMPLASMTMPPQHRKDEAEAHSRAVMSECLRLAFLMDMSGAGLHEIGEKVTSRSITMKICSELWVVLVLERISSDQI